MECEQETGLRRNLSKKVLKHAWRDDQLRGFMKERQMGSSLVEAKLVTLCCSEPPKGFAKRSLRLLADKIVELNYVESISHVTVRNVLKKELNHWKIKCWVIPPELSREFVANMERVLYVCKRHYLKNYPVVCMDESPKQLIEEARFSISMKPNFEAKEDYDMLEVA